MAHFAFIGPPLRGHFDPMIALAATLVGRGHKATFIQQADAARMVARPGIGFHAIGQATHPPGALDEWTAPMADMNLLFGLRGMIREMAGQTSMICDEAPGAMRAIGIDAVVADQMEPAAGMVAEHLGLPFVTAANALLINREPGVPPPFLGWRYDGSAAGIRRNIGGYRVADWLMGAVGDTIERQSRRLGLPTRRRADQCFSPRAQIAQAVAGIDFPRRALPATFHYTGPFREPDTARWSLPNPDGRPLVYCSLGTLMGSHAAIFRRVCAVCRDLDLRLVLVHCGRLGADEVARLPGDALVYDFVPQRAVIAQASLVITHAGFNTAIDALDFGVPMVAIPLAFEQPATAARLAYAGVAEVLPRRFGEARLRAAVERVLGDPGYRRNAGRISAEIAAAGGVARAADIAEACLV